MSNATEKELNSLGIRHLRRKTHLFPIIKLTGEEWAVETPTMYFFSNEKEACIKSILLTQELEEMLQQVKFIDAIDRYQRLSSKMGESKLKQIDFQYKINVDNYQLLKYAVVKELLRDYHSYVGIYYLERGNEDWYYIIFQDNILFFLETELIHIVSNGVFSIQEIDRRRIKILDAIKLETEVSLEQLQQLENVIYTWLQKEEILKDIIQKREKI